MTATHHAPALTLPTRWLALAGFLALTLAAVIWRGYDGAPLKPYHFTQYLFTYETEFLKRGLHGEVLRWMLGDIDYHHVTAIGWGLLALYAALLAALAAVIVAACDFARRGWLLAAVVVTSPATLGHFIFDFGRMDVVLIALLALGVVLLCRGPSRGTLPALGLIALLSLLIHEAAFFMTLPLLFALWLYTDRRRAALLPQAVWAVAILVLTYVISTKGLAQVLAFEPHLAQLQARYGEHISHYALEVLFMDLQKNISFSAEEAISRARALQHVFLLIVLGPLIAAYLRIAYGLWRLRDWYALRVLAAALGPFLLYPLGHDHFRWWALATGNLFLATGVLLWLKSPGLRDALFQDRALPWLLSAAIVLGLMAGPLEVRRSFDITPSIIAAMGLGPHWAEL